MICDQESLSGEIELLKTIHLMKMSVSAIETSCLTNCLTLLETREIFISRYLGFPSYFSRDSVLQIWFCSYLPRLETVYLYDNQMMSLTPALFQGTFITTLWLSNNPWHCDCELATFVLWTQQTGVQILDYAHCAHPDDLRGLNIKNLTTSLACK